MTISIEKKRQILGILLFVFVLNFVLAASILDELHLNIQTTDSGGNVITGTYNFDFNISTTSDCNNVVYSDSATLTTDSRGIISYYLENVNLDYDNQYYLCHYRNGVLINNSKISRTPYAFRAKYVNTSGIEVDSNLDLSGYNFTADYLFGDGSQLTNLNVSAIDLSDYVPYTGANQNLVLGANNFSVGSNALFVDSDSGFVGVGTDSQPDSKTFFSVYRATENSNIRVATGSSGAFASIQMLSGGTHWELGTQGTFANGNLIIRPSSSGNSDMFNFMNTGRFGIGTSTPQNDLNVIGDGNVTGTMYADSFVGDGSGLTNLNISSLDMSDYYTSAQIESFGYYNLSSFDIGDYYLVSNPNNYLNETTLNVSGINYWTQVGNDLYYTDGNVGIGTTSPQQELHVNGSLQLTDNVVSPESVTFDAETSVGLRFTNPNGYVSITPLNTGWAHIYTDRSNFIFDKPIYSYTGKFHSYNVNNLTLNTHGDERMRIVSSTGNVGINTTNPQNTLNVVGDGNFTGTLTVGVADVYIDGEGDMVFKL